MTWSYSDDPTSSDKDEVRFLVQDTDPTVPLLTDEEIIYLVGKYQPRFDSNTGVAAMAAAAIARKFTGYPSVSADGVEIDVSGLVDKYTAMASDLRLQYEDEGSTGMVDLTNLMMGQDPDPSIIPLSFARGMHDNPAAGIQDFGGWSPLVWQLSWPLLPGAES